MGTFGSSLPCENMFHVRFLGPKIWSSGVDNRLASHLTKTVIRKRDKDRGLRKKVENNILSHPDTP